MIAVYELRWVSGRRVRLFAKNRLIPQLLVVFLVHRWNPLRYVMLEYIRYVGLAVDSAVCSGVDSAVESDMNTVALMMMTYMRTVRVRVRVDLAVNPAVDSAVELGMNAAMDLTFRHFQLFLRKNISLSLLFLLSVALHTIFLEPFYFSELENVSE